MQQKMKSKNCRPLRLPTPDYLARVAEYYLARFAATEASVRRVLQNRIRRATVSNPELSADTALHEQLKSAIETIIKKYQTSGVINDAAYADMKRAGLRRAGRSRNAITQKLQAKGVKQSLILEAFTNESEAEDQTGDTEMAAALKLAKRKKFGRFAIKPMDVAQLQKQIASMARAGFRYEVIKQVLGDFEHPLDED
jgi:regulatory protein